MQTATAATGAKLTTSVLSHVQRPAVRPSAAVVPSQRASAAQQFIATWPRSEAVRQVQTQASQAAEAKPDGRADLGNLVAAGAFALHKYGQIHVDRTLILKAFAILALGNAAVNLLKRAGTYDHVASVAAPAVLAVYVLNANVSFIDATVAVLGWRLAETSEGQVNSFEHLIFWGVIASLAAALYYNTSTLWYVLVFTIVNVLRLLRVRGGQASPVFTVPALAISGWAMWTKSHHTWALMLFLAQIIRSAFISAEGLASKADVST